MSFRDRTHVQSTSPHPALYSHPMAPWADSFGTAAQKVPATPFEAVYACQAASLAVPAHVPEVTSADVLDDSPADAPEATPADAPATVTGSGHIEPWAFHKDRAPLPMSRPPVPEAGAGESDWDPVVALGVGHDAVALGAHGATLGFGIARGCTRLGFGLASLFLRNAAGVSEALAGPNAVGAALYGTDYVVAAARRITETSQSVAEGITHTSLKATQVPRPVLHRDPMPVTVPPSCNVLPV